MSDMNSSYTPFNSCETHASSLIGTGSRHEREEVWIRTKPGESHRRLGAKPAIAAGDRDEKGDPDVGVNVPPLSIVDSYDAERVEPGIISQSNTDPRTEFRESDTTALAHQATPLKADRTDPLTLRSSVTEPLRTLHVSVDNGSEQRAAETQNVEGTQLDKSSVTSTKLSDRSLRSAYPNLGLPPGLRKLPLEYLPPQGNSREAK